jgi:hypothetical protein
MMRTTERAKIARMKVMILQTKSDPTKTRLSLAVMQAKLILKGALSPMMREDHAYVNVNMKARLSSDFDFVLTIHLKSKEGLAYLGSNSPMRRKRGRSHHLVEDVHEAALDADASRTANIGGKETRPAPMIVAADRHIITVTTMDKMIDVQLADDASSI